MESATGRSDEDVQRDLWLGISCYAGTIYGSDMMIPDSRESNA